MEEILASIRRIISEDGNEARPQDAAADDDEAGVATATADDDVLELTDVVEDEPGGPEIVGTGTGGTEPEPAGDGQDEEQAFPETEEEPLLPTDGQEEADGDRLLSDSTVAASSAALARMMDRPAEPEAEPRAPLPIGDGTRTIEDIVREMLRPMLREWLDRNLPSIVEEIVEREVQKIGRGASRR